MSTFFLSLLAIIWIDLLLSGDNAVVIAVVCKDLPPKQRNIGLVFGALAAVACRVVMSFGAAEMLGVPGLGIAGGFFLLYVAVGLLKSGDDEATHTRTAPSLWKAIVSIAIADMTMSMDNVMAIAALSKGDVLLMSLGVVFSIPIVITCAAIITKVIDRFPVLVWGGAGLLGWIGGGIVASDYFARTYLQSDSVHYAWSALGVVVVLLIGLILRLDAKFMAEESFDD